MVKSTDRNFDNLMVSRKFKLDESIQTARFSKGNGVICGAHVLGSFFFNKHITGQTYLNMLTDQLMPQLEDTDEGLSNWFAQDEVPTHYAAAVTDWLNDNFLHWIERRGHVECSPRPPNLSLHDFFFWDMLNKIVYSMKITDLDHLRQRIPSHCVEDDGNTGLFHRVHLNFAKRIQICVGNHIQ